MAAVPSTTTINCFSAIVAISTALPVRRAQSNVGFPGLKICDFSRSPDEFQSENGNIGSWCRKSWTGFRSQRYHRVNAVFVSLVLSLNLLLLLCTEIFDQKSWMFEPQLYQKKIFIIKSTNFCKYPVSFKTLINIIYL